MSNVQLSKRFMSGLPSYWLRSGIFMCLLFWCLTQELSVLEELLELVELLKL